MPGSYPNANSYPYVDAYSNTHSNSYPNSHAFGNAHSDCHAYGYTNTDCYFDADSRRNTYATTSPDTKAAPDATASSYPAALESKHGEHKTHESCCRPVCQLAAPLPSIVSVHCRLKRPRHRAKVRIMHFSESGVFCSLQIERPPIQLKSNPTTRSHTCLISKQITWQ